MKKETKIIISFIGSGIVGLINTLLIRPEDIGSWKNYVGYVFLIISAANLIWFFVILYKKKIPKNINY
jgi:uncharacterized membrane-anchored protein